jgi:hypothetical protein
LLKHDFFTWFWPGLTWNDKGTVSHFYSWNTKRGKKCFDLYLFS